MGRDLVLAACVMLGLAPGAAAQDRRLDLGRLAAGLELTDKGVGNWLNQLGATLTGPSTERLFVLKATGERLSVADGGRSSVRISPELDTLLRRPDMAVVLVHNHPSNVGLSGGDIGHLAKPGVTAIVAIGHDGSVFIASPGRRMNAEFLEERQYAAAKVEVAKRLRQESPSGRVSVATCDAHLSHLVTLALSKADIIQYWYVLRGASRSSYESARTIFGQVAESAASRLASRSK